MRKIKSTRIDRHAKRIQTNAKSIQSFRIRYWCYCMCLRCKNHCTRDVIENLIEIQCEPYQRGWVDALHISNSLRLFSIDNRKTYRPPHTRSHSIRPPHTNYQCFVNRLLTYFRSSRLQANWRRNIDIANQYRFTDFAMLIWGERFKLKWYLWRIVFHFS